MDAAQALADLTEISSQIEAALIADPGGKVVASTFSEAAKGERVATAALDLLRAAEETRGGDQPELTHLQAATPAGSVFVVRDGRRVLAAVTARDPTAGLIFYDLKTCLRLVEENEEKKKSTRGSSKAKGTKAGGQGRSNRRPATKDARA